MLRFFREKRKKVEKKKKRSKGWALKNFADAKCFLADFATSSKTAPYIPAIAFKKNVPKNYCNSKKSVYIPPSG